MAYNVEKELPTKFNLEVIKAVGPRQEVIKVHPNLRRAIEEATGQLPPAPTIACPHCGKQCTYNGIECQESSAHFDSEGKLEADFFILYYCPENKTLQITKTISTGEKEWHRQRLGLCASSCYIATACYGTPIHKDLDVLRKWRDESLPKWVVNLYYRTSPPIADFIRSREVLRWVIRQPIKGLVEVIKRWKLIKKSS